MFPSCNSCRLVQYFGELVSKGSTVLSFSTHEGSRSTRSLFSLLFFFLLPYFFGCKHPSTSHPGRHPPHQKCLSYKGSLFSPAEMTRTHTYTSLINKWICIYSLKYQLLGVATRWISGAWHRPHSLLPLLTLVMG